MLNKKTERFQQTNCLTISVSKKNRKKKVTLYLFIKSVVKDNIGTDEKTVIVDIFLDIAETHCSIGVQRYQVLTATIYHQLTE
ncbi:MAG: hypothetical protein LBE04_03305 [Prevotellaceae bacterium]|jgi:hypothetical protein|nr:hypothetical protein [Prevotellaceae bacterium]